MNYLIVNSTSHNYILSLYLANGEEFHTTLKDGQKDNIVILLDSFLKQHNFNVQDLNFLGAITGPGSYTGLRVGLSLVNSLGLALNVPIIGVSLLEVLAYSSYKLFCNEDNIPILATVPTYKGGLFGQLFDMDLAPVVPPFEILNNKLEGHINTYTKMNVLTTDIELVYKLGLHKISLFQKQVDITAENIKNSILIKYKVPQSTYSLPLEVLYIKLPNITMKK